MFRCVQSSHSTQLPLTSFQKYSCLIKFNISSSSASRCPRTASHNPCNLFVAQVSLWPRNLRILGSGQSIKTPWSSGRGAEPEDAACMEPQIITNVWSATERKLQPPQAVSTPNGSPWRSAQHCDCDTCKIHRIQTLGLVLVQLKLTFIVILS